MTKPPLIGDFGLLGCWIALSEPPAETSEVMSNHDQIEAALAECRRLYRGPGPCYLPDYLAARRDYHALLVNAGFLDPQFAEKGTDLRSPPWRRGVVATKSNG